MMDSIRQLIDTSSIQTERTFIIAAILYAAAKVIFCIAVSKHAKLNHVQFGKIWTVAALVFSPVVTAVYFGFNKHFHHKVPIVCTSCGKKTSKGQTKCKRCGGTHFSPAQYENYADVKNRVIVLLAVGVALIAVSTFYINYSPDASDEISFGEEYEEDEEGFAHFDFDGVYYDMKGKRYTDNLEVPYYDKDGNEYIYDNSKGLVKNDGSGEDVSFDMALVDDKGYLSVGQFDTAPQVVPFKTQDGTMYYWAKDVSWDKDGNMIYSSNGEPIVK